jgi:Adenine specific DNA methylase Mod
VQGIGEDGLGYRYISGPKKESANKGKFYSGIPLSRLAELKTGKSFKYLPVSNFYDFAGSFGNCRLEGNVDFKGGKKPEALMEMILRYFSNPGDLVLDSFLGSGTTAAVAHKMGRHYIGIELGDHCYSHCLPRLRGVVDGDQSGASNTVGWTGGGGFKFYELAPTLIIKDDHGQPVISNKYSPEMLVAAVAKLHGFTYAPDSEVFWKQGKSQDNSYIYVTTQYLSVAQLDSLARELPEYEKLLICAPAFDVGLGKRYDNINVRKIPQSVLSKCEFGVDNYSLSFVNPPDLDEEEWENA